MTRHAQLARRAEGLLGSAVVATAPVAGGEGTTVTKLRLGNGTQAVMKTRGTGRPLPPTFFAQEAWGLRWLGELDGGVRVPEVLGVDEECLVVAWVEPGRPFEVAATDLGRRLAVTHAAGAPAHGAENDGFIGPLPLMNRPVADATAGDPDTWATFHARRRLLPYARLARDRGALDDAGLAAVERVAARLADLAPEEPPARLHGDLWNGNVLWDGTGGGAVVIDPAAQGGHRESDLAMLALFGLPHLADVLTAYQDVAPLAAGWEERVGLFQLHPLLVHACLFGGGYGTRAATVAARYA